MNMLSDIEIAQQNIMFSIEDIAEKIGIPSENLEKYGNYKAKISMEQLQDFQKKVSTVENRGKLILVTAITPTPAGEGKSTVSVGLGDGLAAIGKKTVIALREPSLGPCFGIKGGACGGGYAQIVPMEDINLHFTGDIHAISIATNLVAALIDNHIKQGNELQINPQTITWKRCVDLNDRTLRNVVIGLGNVSDGVTREDHFSISVASEIMAIICLSRTISELKEKIGNIVIGQNYNGDHVRFGALNCNGAVAALLKDAIKPNIVQTLEKTPAFVHGGPFANIAHGCNSINATLSALACGEYVVTEAGFAADLGAEKFLDIKCRKAGISPDAVVIVATIRALKMHGGLDKNCLTQENLETLKEGCKNLQIHVENLRKFGLPIVVAINKFSLDTENEINMINDVCKNLGVEVVLCESWGKGAEGGIDLAKKVVEICETQKKNFKFMYEDDLTLKEKIEVLAKEIYRASDVKFDKKALKKLAKFTEAGYGDLPICVAKTQKSISHDESVIGVPSNYVFPIRDVQLFAGAGFVVAFAGDIMTMPGLPKMPAALNIDVDDNGMIHGLF